MDFQLCGRLHYFGPNSSTIPDSIQKTISVRNGTKMSKSLDNWLSKFSLKARCWSMGAGAWEFSQPPFPLPPFDPTVGTHQPTATSIQSLTPNSLFPCLENQAAVVVEQEIANLGATQRPISRSRPIFWAKFKRVAGVEFFPRAAAVVAERVPGRRAVGRYNTKLNKTAEKYKYKYKIQIQNTATKC